MNAAELLERARDVLTVRGTVGEPIQQDNMVVVPVAKVRSGAGGGMGQETTEREGRGGGFGITSTPIGAFVIKDGDVTWRPAVDINKIIVGGQVVAVVALLTIRAIVKARSRR
ncbi:MAG: sporulation protein [Actinobacteria bacterium]|nr:MAG: sporulation protein [Actinomycetota bacterium]